MKTKIRILHIDDNLHDRQIVKDALQKEQDEFEIIETDNHLEFELHLSKSDFDLVLSEFNISGLDGLKVLQIVKEKKPETPVIIVTGKGSEEIATEAMKLGAADYVIKSEKHIQNLSPIIRKAIENRKIQDEHKATLIALRKSEERFRLLFNNSMDAVFLSLPDGTILEANTTACNIFGRTEKGLKQVGQNGIIDATDPRLAIVLEERSRMGKCNGELTGLRKDGTPFPIEISSSIFLDSEGSLSTSMTIRDISVRKLRENKLQENERKLKEVQELAHMGFWLWDIKTGNVEWSDEVFKIFCIDPKEFTPKIDSILALSPWPEDNQRDQELIKKAIDTHSPGSYEQKFLRPDKSIGYYYSTFQGNFDEKGNLISIVGTVLDITERKCAEKAFRESENEFRSLAESMPQIVWMTRADGSNIYFNKQWVDYTGQTLEDSYGHGWNKPFHPDDQQRAWDAWQNATKYSATYSLECRLRRADGVYKWWLIRGVPILDTQGNILKWFGTCTDINEIKQTEEAIKATEMRYRRLFESAKDGILILDAETGLIVDVNPYLVKLLGYSTEQFHGKKIWEIGVFSDKIANYDKFIELQQNEYVRYDDLPLKTSDGKQIAVEFVSNVYEVNSQKVIQCNIRDITDRKKANDAIKESKQMLKTVLDTIPVRVFWKDLELKYLGCNKQFATDAGFENSEELIGKDDFQMSWREQAELYRSDDKSVLQSGIHKLNFEEPQTTPDGDIIWLKTSKIPLTNFNSENIGILGTYEDITERKRTEEALRLSEAKFKVIFDNASNGMFLVDLKTRKFFMCNETCARMLGHSKEEFPNLDIADMHPAEDLPFIYEQIGKFSKGEEGISSDIRFKKKNGDIFFADLSPTLITIDNAKFLFILIKDITERKKTEEQQIIQTTALEATAISVVITNAEGTITWVNNAFTLMTGYSKEEAIGKKPSILKSGKHDKAFYKNMWDTIKAGNVWHGEVFNKRKDNSLLTDEMTITPVLDKDGIIRNFIALKQDITERKRLSEALRENEQLLSNTQQMASIGSFKYDFTSNEMKWSDEMYNIFGVKKDSFKLSTESFINNIYPDDRSLMLDWTKRTTVVDNPGALEFRIVRADGTIREILGTGVLQNDQMGKPHHIIGSAQDITERKQAEAEIKNLNANLELKVEERTLQLVETNKNLHKEIKEHRKAEESLRTSEDRLHLATIAGNIGIWDWDVVKDELSWDDSMYLLYDIHKEDFSGTYESWSRTLHPDDRKFVKDEIQAAFRGEREYAPEFRIVHPDGAIRIIKAASQTFREQNGKALRMIGTCIDITEQKQVEKEIKEAKAQAEQANKSKSEFLSNMSHEIRTPMNAILGYAELLSNILEDKTQKDYLKSIMSSGKTLLTIINDILDLSKIEAGKLELTFDYVKTHSFFSEFERIFSWKLAEKGLAFILDIVSGIPAGIYVDEVRLRQIILNIIGNAVNFTQKGHIKLKVYIENPQIVQLSNEKTEEFIDLVIEIEDTGIGISSEFQDQIFEPFSQEQHKNQFGGTGLGLAISRRLLDLMNGTIQLQSKLKKGSTFQIKIPNIAYLRDFERTTYSIQIDPANIVFEKATILIVDDVTHNRKYFVDALKNTNIEIVEAEDGLTAYNLAKDIVPALIITDLRMPKLDGFGLLKKIQGNAKLSHIPVIAYSASAMKEQKERIFNCKFSGLLIKPVRVTALYIELMNYLTYKSLQAPEKDQPPRKELLKQINDKQGLIHSLETVYTDVWKKFEVRQPMDEVREFGENIENLGNAHNAEIIKKYGNELMIAAENFNIESILKLLNKYQGIVEEINEYHSTI